MNQDDDAPENTRSDELWASVEANDVAGVARALDLGPREAEIVLRSARHSRGVSDQALLAAVRAAAPQRKPRAVAAWVGAASAGAAALAITVALTSSDALPARGVRVVAAGAEGTRAARTVEVDVLGPCALADEIVVVIGSERTPRTLRHTSADGRAGTVAFKAPSGTMAVLEATCEGDTSKVVRFEQQLP